jgi:hypothetical protein
MADKTNTNAALRADHRLWQHEDTEWVADIERWRAEHKAALEQLATMQAAVHRHGEALDAHAEILAKHEQHLRDHERALSEFERAGGGAAERAMTQQHQQEAQRHKEHRAAHERIKKFHYTVLAQLQLLKAAFDAAM